MGSILYRFSYTLRILTQFKKMRMTNTTNLELLQVEDCGSKEFTSNKVGRKIKALTDSTKEKNVEYTRMCFIHIQYPKIHHSDLMNVQAFPSNLVKLKLTSCARLCKIRGLFGLTKLQILNIVDYKEVEEFPGIETLISLEVLKVNG